MGVILFIIFYLQTLAEKIQISWSWVFPFRGTCRVQIPPPGRIPQPSWQQQQKKKAQNLPYGQGTAQIAWQGSNCRRQTLHKERQAGCETSSMGWGGRVTMEWYKRVGSGIICNGGIHIAMYDPDNRPPKIPSCLWNSSELLEVSEADIFWAA